MKLFCFFFFLIIQTFVQKGFWPFPFLLFILFLSAYFSMLSLFSSIIIFLNYSFISHQEILCLIFNLSTYSKCFLSKSSRKFFKHNKNCLFSWTLKVSIFNFSLFHLSNGWKNLILIILFVIIWQTINPTTYNHYLNHFKIPQN